MSTRRRHAARILIALTTITLGCQTDAEAEVAPPPGATSDPVSGAVQRASAADPIKIEAEYGGDAPQMRPPADEDPPTNRCLDGTTGTLTASQATAVPFQSVTLAWNATVPSACTVRIFINATQVAKQGTLVVNPQADATYRLRASVSGYGESVLVSRTITVNIPPVVEITANDQVPLFVQAVQSPDHPETTVIVQNRVQLDLSNRQDIAVAPGVTVRSGRGGLQPGALLFTTTRPSRLFMINRSWNVRITGVRIHGPDWGAGNGHTTKAIFINSGTNVHIDHNEIAGWGTAAIDVADDDGTMESPSPTSSLLLTHTVQIYDNYIHHNQDDIGYGVAAGYGAHPYIARNTFEWNRHAIAGDGRPGTGYTAYHNLVLEEGGLHEWLPLPGIWVHTHQFDMHGRNSCWGYDFNCGPAGHTMLIRHNAFFYKHDEAIKLRGTPTVGMFVGHNIFANHLSFSDAVTQEETGLVREPGNVASYNGKHELVTCDFDGDGNNDYFMATGQNWWYRSDTVAPWTFLNASTRRRGELSFGNFDGDNRCDVRSLPDNVVYPGGESPPGLPGGGDPWLP